MPGFDPQLMGAIASGQAGTDAGIGAPQQGRQEMPQRRGRAPALPAPKQPKREAAPKPTQDFMASAKAKKSASSPPKPRPNAFERATRRYGGKMMGKG